MRRYVQFVLAHRAAVLLTCLAITALAVYGLSHAVIASSIIRMFFGESENYARYKNLADRFGRSELIAVAYKDATLLEPSGLSRLERITTALEKRSDLKRVTSLARAQEIKATGDDLLIRRYVDTATRSALLQRLSEDELVGRLLISRDGQSTLLLIELTEKEDRTAEEMPALMDELLGIFIAEGIPRADLHATGLVAETTEATAQAHFTIERIFPITAILLLVVVYILFLRWWPVLITGTITLTAILWTFGLATVLDREVNLLMAAVPGIMMIVGFSDVIHLYTSFYREIDRGIDRHQAILHTSSEVGVACAFTALTELVGFGSMAFVPTPIMRHFAITLGFGVAATLFLVLTLVPIYLSVLPLKDKAVTNPFLRDRVGPLLDRTVAVALAISTKRPWLIVGLFAALLAASVAGLTRMTIDTDFSKRLAEKNHIRVAQQFLADRFATTNFVDIYLTAPEPGGLLDPAVYQKIAAYTEALDEAPGIDRATSLIDLIELLQRELRSDQPISRELLAQYLLLFEVSGGSGLEQLIDEERTTMRIVARTEDGAVRAMSDAGNRARALASEYLGSSVNVFPTGLSYLFGDWLDEIITGQRQGLLFSVLTTALMLMICFRSFRAGAVSIIPNLFPLILLGGYLGLAYDKVDSDSLVIASIAMGLAVDDTIHFVRRFKLEQLAGHDTHRALALTCESTGRAIVQTSLILCLGFLPFSMSQYYSTRIMGTLLPMTLLSALITELLLMPALVTLGLMRFTTKR